MKTNYVFIDYENVQVEDISKLKGEQFRVKVFLGPSQTKLSVELVMAMQALGERAEYIRSQSSGRNALDFLIAFHLGVTSIADQKAFFHIVSQDTGFDPLIQHLKSQIGRAHV